MTCLITEEKNPDVFSPKDISGTRRGFKNQTRIKKHLEANNNENTMIQNLSNEANTVLRGKLMAI